MNTNNEFDYYLIDSDNTPSVPLLMSDKNQHTMMLLGEEPIAPLETPMKLCFNPPIPRKPCMVDYHSLPESVFSKKIYEVLQPMNIYGLQLLPATIRAKNEDYYEDYWVAYVYNQIICLDMELSKYEVSKIDGELKNIMRFVLDNKKLAEIPLERRLVFLMKEDVSKIIYHKSVVDAIMSANPVGIQFYPIHEWHEGFQFN